MRGSALGWQCDWSVLSRVAPCAGCVCLWVFCVCVLQGGGDVSAKGSYSSQGARVRRFSRVVGVC